MANEEPAKRVYPYMPLGLWASLRAALVKTAPRSVTTDYLQSVLGISEKNARNIHPQLRNLGVIDAENQLTDVGKDLRSDEHYADACDKMVALVYPDAITDVFVEPTGEDLERIVAWFMRNANSSVGTAKPQAKFYSLLKGRKIPAAEAAPRSKTADGTGKKPTTPTGSLGEKQRTTKSTGSTKKDVDEPETHRTGAQNGLSLQLNLQIHISPDAPPDQIDAIFASIKKHLDG